MKSGAGTAARAIGAVPPRALKAETFMLGCLELVVLRYRIPPESPVPSLTRAERHVIELASGVRWEELSASSEDRVDFLHATYEVGGASTPEQSLIRHHGREYGYVMSGTLGIQIGFEEYELNAGDSIAFDSTLPHRLFNKCDQPVHAIWFVVGRDADDRLHSD